MAQDSGLREMVLDGSAQDLGFEPPETPWLLVMETGVPGGSYTVIATHDGTASIYFSNGGGIIGAGEHAAVAAISRSIVGSIHEFQDHFAPVGSSTKRPGSGRTVFYYRQGIALNRLEVDEELLGNGEHPVSPLFYQVHELIGAIRHHTPEDDD